MKNKRVFLILLGLFAGILAAEIWARVYYFTRVSTNNLVLSRNQELIYEHKPSTNFINDYGIRVNYNSLGFIGSEVAPKSKGVLRILALGDSITESPYLKQEERYIERVAEALVNKYKINVEVVNAATAGYNTWQELGMLKGKGIALAPDLIIVGICLNDYVRVMPTLKKTLFGRVCENLRDGSKARHFDFLYQRSDLYKLVYDLLYNMRRGIHSEEGYETYMERYAFDIKEKDFLNWRKPFLDMAEVAAGGNSEILFVIFPLKNEVLNKEPYSYEPLSDFFKKEWFYYIDLIGDFNAYSRDNNVLFRTKDLIHPNALGHRIAAERISEYIINKNLLTRRIQEK